LAASALANQRFSWQRRDTTAFRVYFASDSYAARQQDSLLTILPAALDHARRQPDLRAYLQAAAFVEHLLRTHGTPALESIWRRGSGADTKLGGRALRAIEADWRSRVAVGTHPDDAALDRIEADGCGGTARVAG
jgi:hypothetical protein